MFPFLCFFLPQEEIFPVKSLQQKAAAAMPKILNDEPKPDMSCYLCQIQVNAIMLQQLHTEDCFKNALKQGRISPNILYNLKTIFRIDYEEHTVTHGN